MKRLKLAVIAMFALVTVSNVNAQDENNPWALSAGVNIVDMYSGNDFGSQFEDMLGNKDWNFMPSFRIAGDKYLDNGFGLQLAFSTSNVTHHLSEDDSDYTLWSLGAMVKYDLNNLFGQTGWFDPYVGLGGDYVSSGLHDETEVMAHGALGFNVWFNDNLGLNFQHGSKLGFAENVRSYYQNSISVVYKFGGKDTDGDGVYDEDDACPEVPGLKEFNGCPDADGDGIKDSDDACPDVAGLASMNGCPDSDGDGVADKDDMCPNEKGTKANKGCPDSDGDGVANKDDKCPSVAGAAANGGCPWPDTDGDGVLDKDDKCPAVAGSASNNGCPDEAMTEEQLATLSGYSKEILFGTDRANVAMGTAKKLDQIYDLISTVDDIIFVVEGHADNTGAADYNKYLSERRAASVKAYLVKKGFAENRLETVGYGEEKPVATNDTRAGRSKNRRVVIKLSE